MGHIGHLKQTLEVVGFMLPFWPSVGLLMPSSWTHTGWREGEWKGMPQGGLPGTFTSDPKSWQLMEMVVAIFPLPQPHSSCPANVMPKVGMRTPAPGTAPRGMKGLRSIRWYLRLCRFLGVAWCRHEVGLQVTTRCALTEGGMD
jgi:hypothetical protein